MLRQQKKRCEEKGKAELFCVELFEDKRVLFKVKTKEYEINKVHLYR